MKTLFVFFILCIGSVSTFSQSALKKFFSPIPPLTDKELQAEGGSRTKWDWRPAATIPALKLVESSRPNASIDGYMLTSAGGGITYQKLVWESNEDNPKKGKWVSKFSWSPLTVLVAGNFDGNTAIDVSPAMTVGFFQNLLMLGGGYDLGTVPSGRSRFFGAISININFNN